MYVTLGEASRIVWRRWRDPALRRAVSDYVGTVPDFLRNEPRAVLARQVATPNFEFFRFAALAQKAGLRPHCPEYVGDKFCTKNPDKLLLGKMTFFRGQADDLTCCSVMKLPRYDGKPFAEAKTLWGEGLVAFHHRLLAAELPAVAAADLTDWLNRMGGKPALFWHRLLALFICHGILFDNFHSKGHEEQFTREIIRPALERVEAHFALKPLVVPVVPVEREREAYWSWYPGHLEPALRTGTMRQTGVCPSRQQAGAR